MIHPVDYTKISDADDWKYAQFITMIRAGDFESLPEELLPEKLVNWFREETKQLPFELMMRMCAAAEYIEKQDRIIKAYSEIIRKTSEERRERENQQPLTYAELLNMHGEPVYVTVPGKPHRDKWCIVETCSPRPGLHGIGYFCDLLLVGTTAVKVYRHKPKGE